jgi:hypothetical protein
MFIFGFRLLPLGFLCQLFLMIRTAAVFAVSCLLLASLAYGASVTLFQADFDGTKVRVEWEVSSETSVQSYDIWRKANNEPAFAHLATVQPSSQRRYQYQDNNVYRNISGTGGGPFTYRLTVRSASGEQSYTSVLNTTPSAVQSSWVSIKSMFR